MEKYNASISYFSQQSLSAFYFTNLSKLDQFKFTISKDESKRPLAMNIRLTLDTKSLYGDLAPLQYISNALGRSLSLDNWVFFLLFDLKDQAEKYLFSKDKSDSLEKLKSNLKSVESDFLPILKNDIDPAIEVLFFSMLTPLDAILNKSLKTALSKVSGKFGHKFETAEFLKQKEHN